MVVTVLVACEPTDSTRDLVFELQEGVDTVVAGSAWQDASVRATLAGETLDVHVDYAALDLDTPGEYTVVYSVTVNRNIHTLERTVFVVAPSLPWLQLNPGIDTLVVGETFVDAGVTVLGPDQADYDVLVSGVVATDVPGDYAITYSLLGPQGIVDVVVRRVTIVEADTASGGQ